MPIKTSASSFPLKTKLGLAISVLRLTKPLSIKQF